MAALTLCKVKATKNKILSITIATRCHSDFTQSCSFLLFSLLVRNLNNRRNSVEYFSFVKLLDVTFRSGDTLFLLGSLDSNLASVLLGLGLISAQIHIGFSSL